ncbi:C39 family peptidase [Roseofilum capinflatum]|uniref:C39 family peptidase n=1 Tax=Roseofilum capinflatum BLCC-M114 TaxID=3022440 RepID=A0ABT7B649_9CYAN|nr:C39 family peptidase [Roseofilum capinflatum]MDJ1174639.1 C39 family peptidase [Roseofilum capinflatum BLCC-M114]
MKYMKAKANTKLKKLPLEAGQLKPEQIVDVPAGKSYGFEALEAADNGHIKVTLAANSGTFYVFAKHWDGLSLDPELTLITQEQAEQLFGNPIYPEELKDLNHCLHVYQINTKDRLFHFLSQIAHESGGLKYLKELGDGSYLEGRDDLGNINPGDGPKYKGAGAIQLTGRSNYQAFCNFRGDAKIMEGCDYVAKNYPFSSAGFWWQNNRMNELCDRGATVEEVTQAVNGGYNGLEDRKHYYQKAKSILSQRSFKKILLDVPWFPQTDNYIDPTGTCNASSCAMCLEYFRPGTLPGKQGDDAYLKVVCQYGDSIDHTVQGQALSHFGLNSSWHINLDFEDVYRELEAGRPVVIGILHRGTTENPSGSGHIIVVRGRTENGDFIVNDPYGSIHDNYKGAVENGRSAIYSRYEMKYRWTADGPGTGWGRFFQPCRD